MIIFDNNEKASVERISLEDAVLGMAKVSTYNIEQAELYINMMEEMSNYLERTDYDVLAYRQLDRVNRLSYFYEVRTIKY